jgi:hypothetical protein
MYECTCMSQVLCDYSAGMYGKTSSLHSNHRLVVVQCVEKIKIKVKVRIRDPPVCATQDTRTSTAITRHCTCSLARGRRHTSFTGWGLTWGHSCPPHVGTVVLTLIQVLISPPTNPCDPVAVWQCGSERARRFRAAEPGRRPLCRPTVCVISTTGWSPLHATGHLI